MCYQILFLYFVVCFNHFYAHFKSIYMKHDVISFEESKIRKIWHNDEWKNRGVKEGQEYAVLTAEIARGTFGLTPSQHSKLKGLEKENLRDHMTNLELIFTMLGEDATRSYAVEGDAKGFNENFDAAQKGGHAAGGARMSFEKLRNQTVVSPENYLHLIGNEGEKTLNEPNDEKNESFFELHLTCDLLFSNLI